MRRGSVWSLKGMAIRGQEVFQKKLGKDLCWIFEVRFLFEDGEYWMYSTDEKRNIDRKDEQRLSSFF